MKSNDIDIDVDVDDIEKYAAKFNALRKRVIQQTGEIDRDDFDYSDY